MSERIEARAPTHPFWWLWHGITWPLRALLLHPRVRYSRGFFALQRFAKYMAYEELTKTCLEFVKQSRIEGDYLEFGVYVGTSFSAAYHLSERLGISEMRYLAFDSFDGLPNPDGVDSAGFRHFEKGEYKCDERTFCKNLERNGVDMTRVKIIPGWFEETLTEQTKARLSIDKAAVVMVDCDLYESTVRVLDFLTDLVQDGTVIMFDDWFCYRASPERGQRRAFSEWLRRNPSLRATEFHKMGWGAISFILHRS